MSTVTFSPPIGYINADGIFTQFRKPTVTAGDLLGFNDDLELDVISGITTSGAIANTTNLIVGDGAGAGDDSGIDPADVVVTADLTAYVPITREINSHFLSSDVLLLTSDIDDSPDKRYMTDANRTVLNNTSGTNTGDQNLSGYVPTSRTVNTYPLSSDVTLATSDVADSSDKRYVTDAELAVLAVTSGTNTGDQTEIDTIDITATEDIAAYAPAIITGATANSDNALHLGKVAGLASADIASGADGDLITFGKLTNGSWSWTPGASIFLSGTGLSMTPVMSGFLQVLGIAKTATTILVNIQTPIYL